MKHAFASMLVCSMFSTGAFAQSERDQAREIAAEATRHYNLGRFEEALATYQRAYDVFAAPQLLFNLGQCNRELNNYEQAVFFFERFLEQMPEAPNVETVRGLIVDTRGAMERARVAAEAEREREELRLQHERELREAELRTQLTAEQQRERELDASLQSDQGRERGVHQKWWFWTIIAVAVIGAGVGVGVAVGGQDTVLPSGSAGTVDAR